MQLLAFRTLGKRWLLSSTSLPPGETGVREQAAEIPFFRSLLENRKPPKENKTEGVSHEHPVVLITGALTGIGRATAIAFAREGARIVVSGRRDEVGQTLLVELREIGDQAEYWRADVRHEGDVRDLVNKTVTRFGRLDIAVNNAATEGPRGSLTEQTPEGYAA